MKQTLKRWLLPLLLLSAAYATAQEVQKGNPGMWPKFIRYSTTQPVFVKSAPVVTDGDGRTTNLTQVRLLKSEADAAGLEHHRYQQTHNGIPVEHATWLVHVRNGRISHENGSLVKDFPGVLPKTPSINAASAIEAAKTHIGARQYKWELADEEALLRQMQPGASYMPKPRLVYYSGDREVIPTALRLAWKMDVYAHDPMSHQTVFVDAMNSKILGTRNLIHEADAPGTAVTAYSGTQPMTADFTGVLYRLRETGRGNGINTYNMKNAGTNYAAATDFTDADNNWNNINADLDQYATDAHWGAEKTYDYFLTRFNRNSIDGDGFALNSYVHTNLVAFGYPNNINAFWDGYKMTYGDGGPGYTPLTALDIVAHEITHGLTQRTSGLVYSYESGAMNEAFSDIFGAAIEFYAKPGSANWLLGENIGAAFRNMSNPNQFNHPDTYLGTYWYTGSGDNGGVHYNSGVLNFWFYLLSAGGSGTNDHGYNYAVTGIGINDAAAIAYRLNAFYLFSTASYYDARTLGVQAAEDLFGIGSNQAIQTANAFAAVGLYAPTCAQTAGLAVTNLQDISATLTWNATPGAGSYQLEYRLAGSATWYSLGSTADTFKHMNSLNPVTIYEWRVRSNCNMSYSYHQFTTTAAICSPPGNLSFIVNGTNVTLGWDYTIWGTSYTVEYKPAANSGWTALAPQTTNSAVLTGLDPNTVYHWRVRSNCGADSSNWATSQFTTNAPVCATPTGLTTSFAPGLVTKLSWSPVPGALQYRVQLDWAGTNWDSGIGMDTITSDTSWTIVGFGSGFSLQWRVAPNCGNNFGNWASTQFITPCPAPASILVGTVTANTAQINWTSGGANTLYGYTVQYKLSTATAWTTAGTTGGTSLALTNLQQGKVYDVRVRTNCQSINSTYAQTQFSTPCTNSPSGLNFTRVTTNSAILTWGAVAGTTSYTLQYKLSTASTWTSVTGITTNTYTLTGLAANTSYHYRVQSNCTAGGPAAFSAQATFKTYCISTGNNTQEWIDYVKFGSMERFSGADAGGYFNSAATYTPFNHAIGSSVAGIISAGYSSTVRNEFYAVYMDLNRNGSFADAGERLAGQTAITNAGNYNFTVTIPATATPGITAVRFVMLRQPTAVQPCLTGNRGETEDFYVNLVTAPAMNGFAPETVSNPAIETPVTEIQVQPNPSSNIFRITPPKGFAASRYEVVNTSGNPVMRNAIRNPGMFEIDASVLPAGLYLLRLTNSEGRQQVVKLVKQ